ncbi:pilus assembly protein [Pseudomonas sp. CC6-YY-74]|uniref:pilus assembly protein n=1 Tax=Pseudomonas sp. CC6-YY-74 TaxID=1930532 RepID=UPI0012ABC7F5|nr:PilC/PilY family type IV pilus protein [Pseudomonas sp. CC6-YY-74]
MLTSLSCSRSNSDYTITSNDLRTSATGAYYYVYDQTQPSCPTVANRKIEDNCYTLRVVSSTSGQSRQDAPLDGVDERQNFAIWYSFYRTRALATLSAANLAFNELSPSVRLTWQSLGGCTSLNSNNCSKNYLREFGTQHKGNFFNWLGSIDFNQSTPLRVAMDRAGKFLQTDTAWASTPNPVTTSGGLGSTVTNPVHACRPSYHVMMTDGMWNGADGSPSGTLRADHSNFTLPDGKSYSNSLKPFADAATNTLADLAMHYWATDLRPTLANDLKPYTRAPNSDLTKQYWNPKNDPASWQHMVNFTMGLALTSSLTTPGIEWSGDTFAGAGYGNLVSGAQSWPEAGVSSNNNVYDLWHAAVNSRGEFFSVESPDDMVKAFKDILNRIADRTTSAARPAVSASFVSDATDNSIQSNVYATQFSSEDWSGELTKTLINSNGVQTLQWSAKSENQNIVASTRKVMIKDSTNSTSKLKNFTWGNLDSLQQGWLNRDPASLNSGIDSKGADRVAYIRGDRSQEGTESTTFRKRSTVIGDIINSSPVVVGTPAYLAYLADQIENPNGTNPNYKSYAAFRTANVKTIRKEMIYVGGNDGMLHGFNAKTGKEEFAFIPTEVIKNLYRLTGQNYKGGAHHYYVDGSPIVRDVYFGDAENEGWHTILIGTLRAGGKALFALDITDPANIKLLWEFDSSIDSDLGNTFAQPEITRLHTGQWAVLMGNGYNSINDRAALLIIDIKTGNLLKKLVAPNVVEAGVTLSNGLSSVRGADNNGDGLVDYAYAGDLQGNLWRFDLIKAGAAEGIAGDPFARSSVTTNINSDFKIAYGGNPLFTARDADPITAKRQAITIQPSLVRHPSGYGYLVLIGTGKYFENSDANVDTSRAMTLYGVWDRKTKRQATIAGTARATDRTKLGAQQFTSQDDSAEFANEDQIEVNAIRLLSQNQIKWYKDTATDLVDDTSVDRWGWKLNLAVNNSLTGEMIVNNMAARGQTLFVTSLTPNQDPCKAGADTWLYGISAYTGGRTKYNVLDLNNDQIVNSKDTYGSAKDVVSGVRFPAIGGFTLAPGNKIYGSDGANDPGTVGDDPNTAGRQSWHIVPEEFQ